MLKIKSGLFINKDYYGLDILFCLLSYFTLFHKIGTASIYMWDESVYAVNAIEMAQNGNFLIKYFNGKPELWGTEPPLVAWIHVFFIKLFGYNETAIRIPSALAIFATSILIIRFYSKEFQNRYLGYLSALILLTTSGIVRTHVSRTADLDAFLTLFTFAAGIYFYKYLKYDLKRKYLFISVIFLIFAFYSKSIAGLLFLPGMLAFTIHYKKLKKVLSMPSFYVSILGFIVIVGSYYFLRELYNPDYIKTAWNNEIATRYFEVNDGHSQPFNFYFKLIMTDHFKYWFYFIPFSIFISFIVKNKKFVNFVIYNLYMIIFFLLTISFSKTKIDWYNAPVFPYLASLTGIGIYYIFYFISAGKNYNSKYKKTVITLIVITLFTFPIKTTIEDNFSKNNTWIDEKYGVCMKNMIHDFPDIKNYTILVTGWNGHIKYYSNILKWFNGYNITERNIHDVIKINENEILLYWHPAATKFIKNNYNYTVLKKYQVLKNRYMYLVAIDKKL